MKSLFEDGVNKKLDKFLSCHDLTQAVATQGGVRTLSNVETVPIKTKLPIKNTRCFTKPLDHAEPGRPTLGEGHARGASAGA